jgi:predicted ATPase/class 3 adenylate cyclase/Tfp pilus assembly protein PilF
MQGAPTGTVTFLLTDVEGSTRHWEEHPDAMRAALEMHDAVMRDGVESAGGMILKSRGEGDSVFAVFARARDAVAAALRLQLALNGAAWPDGARLRVRMAAHTGEAIEREGDYYGPAVNRAARLRSAAHGGQVLVSAATVEVVGELVSGDAGLLDLGPHRLQDLVREEHVYQLTHPELPSEFPPLKTLSARPNNLPAQPTRLVGREDELKRAKELVCSPGVRLVTFVGPAGIGKTRFAVQVAAELVESFPGGAWFVSLVPVRDAAGVLPEIAKELAVREEPGQARVKQVAQRLRGLRTVLVLDNYEHVIEAATVAADLLAACSELTVLATSREPLRLRGEYEVLVPTLPVPGRAATEEDIERFDAVQLFVERAWAADASFRLEPGDAPAVAEICARLDGLPLAIELAAARVKVFAPKALLARLDSRLRLLTGGARDLPERHRTLRGAIEWSYELLSEPERVLLRRLAVFAEGCTLDAAEAVCGEALGADVTEGMVSLVERSLLRRAGAMGDEPRFEILSTIREFALEKLEASSETAAVAAHHAAWYVSLAEEASGALRGAAQASWLDRLEREHANLRAALDTLEGADDFARLTAALAGFWTIRGHLTEGRAYLERALTNVTDMALRVRLLKSAGEVMRLQADGDGARRCYAEALAMCRVSDDSRGAADATIGLGVVAEMRGDEAGARALYEEALAIFTELGDDRGIVHASNNLAILAWLEGDHEVAREQYRRCLDVARRLGDALLVASMLNNLGGVAYERADLREARKLYEESLTIRRRLGDRRGIAEALNNLGGVALDADEADEAGTLFEESISIARELDVPEVLALGLMNLGEVARTQHDLDRAEALLGEALDIRRTVGDRRGAAEVLAELGAAARARGDGAAARSLLEEALHDAREVGAAGTVSRALAELASLAAAAGDTAEAARLAEEALGVARDAGDPRGEARALALLSVPGGGAAQSGLVDTTAPGDNRFVREGQYWTIVYDGKVCRLRDSKGLRYLSLLLVSPHRELHVLDLVAAVEGSVSGMRPVSTELANRGDGTGDAGAILDAQARDAYRERLAALAEELDEARGFLDDERAARLESEINALESELAAAYGLGGRERLAASAVERARLAVTKAIGRAMQNIADGHPALARHLATTLHTGTFCAYTPDPRVPITWTA